MVLQAVSWSQQSATSAPADELKPIAANAPKDKPADVTGENLKDFEDAIAPYVAQARASLPDAKKRFKKGLKPGEVLYITSRLAGQDGKFEQVFVQVNSWKGNKITGLLASEMQLVKEHRKGEKMTVQEKDVYDWTISKPDGTEDGNYVGKFLDNYHR
jgi:uncharacterized protein YegJ (DUF2314 family)